MISCLFVLLFLSGATSSWGAMSENSQTAVAGVEELSNKLCKAIAHPNAKNSIIRAVNFLPVDEKIALGRHLLLRKDGKGLEVVMWLKQLPEFFGRDVIRGIQMDNLTGMPIFLQKSLFNTSNSGGAVPFLRGFVSCFGKDAFEWNADMASPNCAANCAVRKALTSLDGGMVHALVNFNLTESLEALLWEGQGYINPNVMNGDGSTPLQCAIIENHIQSIKALLEVGANPNIGDASETTLTSAVVSGDNRVVSWLLDRGANIDDQSLYAAAHKPKDLSILGMLLKRIGAPIDEQKSLKVLCLLSKRKNNAKFEEVRPFININGITETGNAWAHLAALFGKDGDTLLSQISPDDISNSLEICNTFQETPVHVMVMSSKIKMLDHLKSRNLLTEEVLAKKDFQGRTAFEYALEQKGDLGDPLVGMVRPKGIRKNQLSKLKRRYVQKEEPAQVTTVDVATRTVIGQQLPRKRGEKVDISHNDAYVAYEDQDTKHFTIKEGNRVCVFFSAGKTPNEDRVLPMIEPYKEDKAHTISYLTQKWLQRFGDDVTNNPQLLEGYGIKRIDPERHLVLILPIADMPVNFNPAHSKYLSKDDCSNAAVVAIYEEGVGKHLQIHTKRTAFSLNDCFESEGD